MTRFTQVARSASVRLSSRVFRRCLLGSVLTLSTLVLLHALALEAYQIPTGSMAPTLRGLHRVCACPRCGHVVVVGRSSADADGTGDPRYYRKAGCVNCGFFPVPITESIEVEGDRVLVNKTAFLLRAPTRWEIVVFRLLDALFIKRLLGLPGESILIRDGDLYVNGKLLRKSLAEAQGMRILVFDQEHAPAEGWRCRWESDDTGDVLAPRTQAARVDVLALDGRVTPRTLTYRNYSLETAKCEPLRDEYAYNAGLHPDSECVHDFLMETEVEIVAGRGSLALRLCDGHDWVEVLLPVGEARRVEAFSWPSNAPAAVQKLAESERMVALERGRRYPVTLAFVDRRLTLALEGKEWLGVDLPEVKERSGVARPFQVCADGAHVAFHGHRLYRDVHYGQQGENAVQGKSVRLGADQYFVLGDNSPNSQDSRFWPDQGRVGMSCLVGSAWLAYGTRPARCLP